MIDQFPIHSVIPQLKDFLKSNQKVILTSPPGSGKTTGVPLSLISETWLNGQKIVMLEPRRLAARLAAGFMSSLLNEEIGRTVGYQVRLDSRKGPETRIEVITGGIFTRRIQNDPELSDVGLVIFDEFHERSLDCDLNLALCLDVMSSFRDDLRILIMSATFDAENLPQQFDNVPVVKGYGKMHPVSVSHLPPLTNQDTNRFNDLVNNSVRGIKSALDEQQGDILVFLPGVGEIKRCVELLDLKYHDSNLLILPLYGNLSLQEQARVVQPNLKGKRKVILATTIAESSVTIEGITTVVDCGWKRLARFDPNFGLTRLETVRISKASALQRQGRAGRLGPGVCYCLWNQGIGKGFSDFDQPEIFQADLASLVLELAAWGVTDTKQLIWFNPPPEKSLEQARLLLVQLGAIGKDNYQITDMGQKMVQIPVHPRLSRLIFKSISIGASQTACDIAALVSERDVLKPGYLSADIEDRLHALNLYRKKGREAALNFGAVPERCRRCDIVSGQLLKIIARYSGKKKDRGYSVGSLLSLAFPDRIAKKRDGKKYQYKLFSGQGVEISSTDHLLNSQYITIAALDVGRCNGKVFLAASIEKQEFIELFSGQFVMQDIVFWDENTQAVNCKKRTCFGSLIIRQTPLTDCAASLIVPIVLEVIGRKGIKALPWDKQSKSLQARVETVRNFHPEGYWPDLSNENLLLTLDQWLAPFMEDVRSLKQLGGLNLKIILEAMLDWQQKKQLDTIAPEFIKMPSGSKIRIQYQIGEEPILAVRIQEVFGVNTTPEICMGRIKLILHLLSPARRPVQITQDLQGFWQSSYNEVKKELKGRYPKHYWPDDPFTAIATSKLRPK